MVIFFVFRLSPIGSVKRTRWQKLKNSKKTHFYNNELARNFTEHSNVVVTVCLV